LPPLDLPVLEPEVWEQRLSVCHEQFEPFRPTSSDMVALLDVFEYDADEHQILKQSIKKAKQGPPEQSPIVEKTVIIQDTFTQAYETASARVSFMQATRDNISHMMRIIEEKEE